MRSLDTRSSWFQPDAGATAPMPDAACERSVHDLFTEVAGRYPARVAVDDGAIRLTYAELAARVLALARRLRAVAPPGGAVALVLPNDARMMVGVLACMASGHACLPINTSYPAERNRAVLAGAAPVAIIAAETPAWLAADADVPRLDPMVEPFGAPDPAALPGLGVDEPAFILYTSGSTGAPKGIVNLQRAVLKRAQHSINAGPVGPDDRIVLVTSPCTVAGLRDCFVALLTGAALYPHDPRTGGLPALRRRMREAGVTWMFSVPSLMRAVAAVEDGQAPFAKLRTLYLGSERTLAGDIALFDRLLPPACVIRLGYGATESFATAWHVPRGAAQPTETVTPIGYLVPGVECRVVAEDGGPAAPGEAGELHLRGRCVALGLWCDGRLVPGAMRPDPADPRQRIYPTGDLVSRDADGLFRMHGRIDRLVKVRGQRVEPAELEVVLRGSPEVADAAVIAREAAGEVALVAFVIPRDGIGPAAHPALVAGLRQVARKNLPDALHPADIHVIEALPTLPNGKLDARALADADRAMRAAASGSASAASEPGTWAEWELAAIFADLLPGRNFGRDDDFLEHGGDSLKAMTLLVEIEQRLGIRLSADAFAEGATIAALGRRLAAAGGVRPGEVLMELQPHGSLPPFFCVHGVGGDALHLVLLARRMGAGRPFIAIRGLEDARAGSIEALAADYVAAVLARQPSGPLHLGGYSFGAAVAFEMARQLRARGREVAVLALIDQALPGFRQGFRKPHLAAAAMLANLPHWWRAYGAGYAAPGGWRRLVKKLSPGFDPGAIENVLDLAVYAPNTRAVVAGHHAMLRRYRPPRDDSRVVLFRCRARGLRQSWIEPGMGWRRVARGGVAERIIPGAHFTMMAEPHVGALAAALNSVLAASAARGGRFATPMAGVAGRLSSRRPSREGLAEGVVPIT